MTVSPTVSVTGVGRVVVESGGEHEQAGDHTTEREEQQLPPACGPIAR